MAERPEPAALVLAGVTKTWRGRAVPVLDRVDLSLPHGSTTWLAGSNGAGKTTLLRVAGSLLAPDAGTVAVAGLDLERRPREAKRRIGFLSAGTSGLYARLTVRQQLDYWSRLSFIPPGDREAVVASAIARFALTPFTRRRLDRMSMGERQRVRLAMAFAHEPDIALLDEPRNSLDEPGIALLAAVVEDHRRAGRAVLWCSPEGDPPGVDRDRDLVLADGRIGVA